jgi:hypothetical protein
LIKDAKSLAVYLYLLIIMATEIGANGRMRIKSGVLYDEIAGYRIYPANM